jgi:hypothetical protein
MSICILEGQKVNEDGSTRAVLYCNTTGTAFGPLFIDADEAEAFLTWWGSQPSLRRSSRSWRSRVWTTDRLVWGERGCIKVDLRELSANELSDEVTGWRLYKKTTIG